MTLDRLTAYCLSKKGVTEEFPFDEVTVVYRVMGKIFVISNIETFESINLKGDPESNAERCERYDAVSPGWHMNKKHWTTVLLDGTVDDHLLCRWIDESYDRVVSGLSKTNRLRLKSL